MLQNHERWIAILGADRRDLFGTVLLTAAFVVPGNRFTSWFKFSAYFTKIEEDLYQANLGIWREREASKTISPVREE